MVDFTFKKMLVKIWSCYNKDVNNEKYIDNH